MRVRFEKKISFTLLCLISISGSCVDKCTYPYREELDKFLVNELNYQIPSSSEVILIMLPLDGCSSCLASTIQLLSVAKRKEDKIELVISTQDKRKINDYGVWKLGFEESSIHLDSTNNYVRYEIGVHVPVIFHFKNGACEFFSETTEINQVKIKKYFDW
jgi:hypothetical protein